MAGHPCDICGHMLAGRACKLTCSNCGAMQDCSDIVLNASCAKCAGHGYYFDNLERRKVCNSCGKGGA